MRRRTCLLLGRLNLGKVLRCIVRGCAAQCRELTHAINCFSLALPRYSSTEVCLAKLRYAVRNAELMDADFMMRSGEGWEGIS